MDQEINHHIYKTAKGQVLLLVKPGLIRLALWWLHSPLVGSVDMEGILSACSWASHSTSTDFYLRDITFLTDGLHYLGSIVAVQRFIMLHSSQ